MSRFGDRAFLKELRDKQAELDLEEQRLCTGKFYKVEVKYNIMVSRCQEVEVLAIDEDDAEELASTKVDEEEELKGDIDFTGFRILTVLDQKGNHLPDEKTLDIFENGKSDSLHRMKK